LCAVLDGKERPREGRGLCTTPEVPAREDTALRADITENRTYRFPLPPHPIAAEQARILVKIALTAWKISDIDAMR
jgi:hypothetical protein